MAPKAPYGVLAEFDAASDLYQACERVRDAGFTRWDAHTPFPVHGLERAMGLKPSILPWFVLIAGLTGAGAGLLMQWWMAAVDYKLVIGGKPFFSWQAFVPIIFELMVLFAAGGAVLSLLHLCKLPRFHHPLFAVSRFERATDDRFFIAIEASDPKFDPTRTPMLLKQAGAAHVEMVDEP